MIELTEAQRQAMQQQKGQPFEAIDPVSGQRFILIPREMYDRLMEHDDSPWTEGEMDRLAAEVDVILDDDSAGEEKT